MPSASFQSSAVYGTSWARTWTNSPKGRPHNKPMPLDFWSKSGKGNNNSGTGGYVESYVFSGGKLFGQDPLTEASNKALERMREKCDGVTATLGTAVAEYRSSFDMIHKRGMQLFNAFVAVKQRRFKKAARLLGLKKVPKGVRAKRYSKDTGGLWLEYWMGWAPSVSDVHNAIKVLNDDSPPPANGVVASATTSHSYSNSYWGGNPKNIYYTVKGEVRTTVKLGGKVRISDHHRRAAHRLGLLAPLTTAFEITPWSWFVGWFSNVGTWLDSMNWFRGLEIIDPYTTYVWKGSNLYNDIYRNKLTIHRDCSVFRCRRVLGWPSYKLVLWDPPSRLSITRAATAISLLVQQFRR